MEKNSTLFIGRIFSRNIFPNQKKTKKNLLKICSTENQFLVEFQLLVKGISRSGRDVIMFIGNSFLP